MKVDGKTAVGLRVDLPDSPPLVAIVGDKGFIMCGFLNIDAAEKLNVAAAMVSGVKTFEDILEAEVKAVTSKAKTNGIRRGMKGREALQMFF
ncbi:MAG: YunC family protein [Candidatus Bathyarchaeia archaeon]